MTVTATYVNSATEVVTDRADFESDDPAIATVSAGGLVTGISAGDAVITATVGSKTATANVEVTEP